MRFSLLFLIILCFGCNKRLEEVAVCPDCTVEQQELIIEAIDEMFEVFPEAKVPVFIGENRGKGAVTIHSDPNEEPCSDSPADTHLTKRNGPNIRLCVDKIRPEIFKLVVLHEMGHAIRAKDGHLEAEGHLMSVETHQYVTGPSEKDIAFIRREIRE